MLSSLAGKAPVQTMTSAPFPTPPQGKPVRYRTWRTVIALFIREMSTTYGRSVGGYIWAIAEPIAGIAILSMIFSIALRSPSIGNNFTLFYATGFLPFFAYMDISQKVATSLSFSRNLLFYPRVTFIDAVLARILLNSMTQTMIFLLMMSGIILIYDIDVILDPPSLVLGLSAVFSLAAGIGTLNCFLTSYYPVWARIWAILTRPLFFISCIFFIFEDVPKPFQDWLWWNPLVHIVGTIRKGTYATYDATYVSLPYVFAVSGITLMLGLVLLKRYHKDIIND